MGLLQALAQWNWGHAASNEPSSPHAQQILLENQLIEHRRKLQEYAEMLKKREIALDEREQKLTSSARKKSKKIIKEAEDTRDAMLQEAARKYARLKDDIEWETAHLGEIMRDIDAEQAYLDRLKSQFEIVSQKGTTSEVG